MNEFKKLSDELRTAGRDEAADAALTFANSAVRNTMRVTHPGQCSYGGECWNGWVFASVRTNLQILKARQLGQIIMVALIELEENERIGGAQ